MSTEAYFNQIRNELYSWFGRIFENPEKMIGGIEWNENLYPHEIFIDPNPISGPVIRKIVIGGHSSEKLGELELKILSVYATNLSYLGISSIRLNKLTKEQRGFLEGELEEQYVTSEEQGTPYRDLLNKIKHPHTYRLIELVQGKLKKLGIR
jgi:hypothetical protein